MSPPTRERDLVWLMNERLGRPTLHQFEGNVPCDFMFNLPGSSVTAWAKMWRCLETGTVRRWGVE